MVSLAKNATFLDLGWSPTKTISFLGRVQRGMVKLARPQRDVLVRMTLDGSSTPFPDYRFEYDDGELLPLISGRNHKPLPEDGSPERERRWSSATMTFDEVSDALIELAWAEMERLSKGEKVY